MAFTIEQLTARQIEYQNLLVQASQEIRSLRGQIGMLRPKAEAYDCLAAVIGMFPLPRQGMGEDIAWKIEQMLKVLADDHVNTNEGGTQ
jgi:small-conductance mechanosensitive channel